MSRSDGSAAAGDGDRDDRSRTCDGPPGDGGTVRLAREIRGDGRALVLLHGGWLDRRLWAPQFERFADRHRTVAVDLRDHGDAGRAGEGYGMAALVADVRRLLDELDADRPVVCGLSLGSLVAQQLAATDPDRVAGLVLASTVASIPPVTLPPGAKRWLAPRAGGHLGVRTLGPGNYFRTLLDWVETIEGGPWLATDDDARAYALDAVEQFDADRFLRVFDALYGFDGVDAAAVTAPALLIHGEREATAVVGQNRRLARQLGADRVAVDSAGHLVNRDRPAAFADAIESFVADLPD